MEFTIPTQAEFEAMKKAHRKDWTELYKALEENKSLIVPPDGGHRMAYEHFKKQGRRVRWKYNRTTDQYGIWLDE